MSWPDTCWAFVLLSVGSVACGDQSSSRQLAKPSVQAFVRDAYPVILRDCSFPACHGDSRRFFQAYGPGRTRLSSDTLPYDEATADELARSYDRARSMLAGGGDPEHSLLLRKPLAVSAGGAGHEGDDPWQQPIYRSPADPRFAALRAWALSMQPRDLTDAGVR